VKTDVGQVDLVLQLSDGTSEKILNFIKAWRNNKYNKRVLIWRITLVLIKINYGQIGDQTGLFLYNKPSILYQWE
jgi:hypothetical protein